MLPHTPRLDRSRLLGLLVLTSVAPVAAATLQVPGEYPSIGAALLAAASGDSVVVAPGSYAELLTLKDGVVLTSTAGPTATTITTPINTYAIVSALDVGSTTVFSGFTLDGINGGLSAEKGFVTNDCAPLVANCIVARFWGIGVHFDGDGLLQDSVVHSCDRAGIYAGSAAAYPTIDRCLIYGCGFAPYIASEGLGGHYGGSFVVRNSTFFGNYDGIYADVSSPPPIVENCIVVSHTRRGIGVVGGGVVHVTCSNVWGNAEDYGGVAPGPGCFSANPAFCDAAAGDFTLYGTSPCAPAHSEGCGLVGAFPVACGPVSLAPSTWGKAKGLFR